ncbi:hypothetical protein AU189_11460 [Mycolicibacterium acapulense]|nr:hypothetical protein AU189_11460 [Mycolicibacterium acapulense]
MTTTTAEKRSDAPELDEQTDTPTAAAAGAHGAHSDAQALDGDQPAAPGDDEHHGDNDDADGDELDENADTFPRKVVEKLRRQNTNLRDRAKAAEATVAHLQRQAADQAIKAAGLKPAAVWAVTKLGDVLDGQGGVDSKKLAAAMSTARDQLGVTAPAKRIPKPGTGGALRSGSGVPQEKPRGFTDAFAPRDRRR